MRTRRLRLAPIPRSAFAGSRFPPDVIVLAVRWYLRFALSFRDVDELMAERGIEVDHVTICPRVQRFTPLLADAARPWGQASAVEETRGAASNAASCHADSLAALRKIMTNAIVPAPIWSA